MMEDWKIILIIGIVAVGIFYFYSNGYFKTTTGQINQPISSVTHYSYLCPNQNTCTTQNSGFANLLSSGLAYCNATACYFVTQLSTTGNGVGH